jgi:hypothetical protein
MDSEIFIKGNCNAKTILPHWFRHSIGMFLWRSTISSGLPFCSLSVLYWSLEVVDAAPRRAR